MNRKIRGCPECGGQSIYATTTPAGGGYGPYFLPRLGSFLAMAKFQVVVCADCGLTRFYAGENARKKLPASRRWQRL